MTERFDKGMMPTKERLAQVLHAAGLFNMEKAARDGYYDDFESPLATPIMQLVIDLNAAGHKDLAERAKNGEWDGTEREAEAWAASDAGKAAFAELMNRKGL